MKIGKGIILESVDEDEVIYWALKEVERGQTCFTFNTKLVKQMLSTWDKWTGTTRPEWGRKKHLKRKK